MQFPWINSSSCRAIKTLNISCSVKSIDIETDSIIANLNLAGVYKKIIRYIYETRPSSKPTLVKQNLSINLCLVHSQFV